jgi:hypothetical protein
LNAAVSRTIAQLEQALKAASERVARAVKALAPKHKGGEAQEFRAAVDEQHRLEREVALAKGEETAVVIDWQPQWDVGAPLPHVLSSGLRTFLVYMVSEPDPDWDGTYANMVDATSDATEPLAIVEFERCYAYKFGGHNDEVIYGHPLYGKGLEAYGAHEVINSRWLAAEQAINSVHRGYRPETWTALKHYLLEFHDDCFECLARGYKIQQVRCSFREAVDRLVGRLFKT